MLLQGLFNIIDIYSNEIDSFYNNINKYFLEKIKIYFEEKSQDKEDLDKEDLDKELKNLLEFITIKLVELGFEREEIEKKFSIQSLLIRRSEIKKSKLNTPIERYEKKIAPIIFEIFLEKVVEYLVGNLCAPIMLKMKSEQLLPIEFAFELANLRNLLEKHPENKENLLKYIRIQDKITLKFKDNKSKIESFEDLEKTKDKLQLTYLIYRIIDFFNLQKIFNFEHIKAYLKNNIDEWLVSIPLVTLKNPDVYFCGIYLANHFLNMETEFNVENIISFLLNLYEENIDEFEVPIIEATDRLYYYLKSTELSHYKLSEAQIKTLVKIKPEFFESHYLKNLETSQLVVILKIFTILGIFEDIDKQIIAALIEEIEKRVLPEGIKQHRDGLVTSEATYYVLFLYYMRNSLDKLKDYDLLNNIISRIYRNLEILDFSVDTNLDLVSEVFYSIESLKLLNCIETKQMIIHLCKYLFPQEVVDIVENSDEITQTTARFRHLKVDRITGETIY